MEAAFFIDNEIPQHQKETLSEAVPALTSWPTHPVSSADSTQAPAIANVPDEDSSDGEEDTSYHFGACPHCGKTNGYMNVGRVHYFVCDRHMVRWRAGSNLFSSWRYETPEEQQESRKKITAYVDVKPIFPDRHLENTIRFVSFSKKAHADLDKAPVELDNDDGDNDDDDIPF